MRLRFILASTLLAIGVGLTDFCIRDFLIVLALAQRRRGPTNRRTLGEYNLPAVPRRDCRTDDVRHLVAVRALIGDTYCPGKFAGQRPPCLPDWRTVRGCARRLRTNMRMFRAFCTRYRGARPSIASREVPARRACSCETHAQLHGRRSRRTGLLLEVLRGNVACGVLAEADKVGSILAQQFRTQSQPDRGLRVSRLSGRSSLRAGRSRYSRRSGK